MNENCLSMVELAIAREYGKIMSGIGKFGKILISSLKTDLENALTMYKLVDLFKNHSVHYSIKLIKDDSGESKIFIQVHNGIHKGLLIENYSVFFLFCKIHGFIPIISNIEIDGNDITQIKELDPLFKFFKQYFLVGDSISWSAFGEISKLMKLLEDNGISGFNHFEIFSLLDLAGKSGISGYKDVMANFGRRFQRKKNISALYEMIFTEIGLRGENRYRDLLGFFSTYIYPATLEEDQIDKTDAKWYYKVENRNSDYNFIGIQLTVGKSVVGKLMKLEKVLINKMLQVSGEKNRRYSLKAPFIVIKMNSKFGRAMLDGALLNYYKKWLGNSTLREQQVTDDHRFPLFIDNIYDDILVEGKIFMFVLHLLEFVVSNSFSFSDQDKDFIGTMMSINGEIKEKVTILSGLDFLKKVFDDLPKDIKFKIDEIIRKDLVSNLVGTSDGKSIFEIIGVVQREIFGFCLDDIEIECVNITKINDSNEPDNKFKYFHRIGFVIRYRNGTPSRKKGTFYPRNFKGDPSKFKIGEFYVYR